MKILTSVNKLAVNPIGEQEQLELKSFQQIVSSINVKVNQIQEEVVVLCSTDKEIEAQVDVSDWFQLQIINLETKIITIMLSMPVSTPQQPNVKLPRIELPTFDGRFEENWQSFQDLFIATIENNPSLSSAQKLQYLKSCVRGEAANLIQSFSVTDQNYREAWGLLTDRFDNKRELIQALIRRFTSQPIIRQESASALQKLLDVTNECLRSLKVMGRSVDDWDDLIVFLIVDKLDPDSRREWAISQKGTNPPTFKQLNDFLEIHIRGLHASSSSSINKPKQVNPHFSERRQASSHHQSISDGPCPVCSATHHLHQCSQFRSMSTNDRITVVKKASLCTNCLRPDHWTNNCRSKFGCKQCNKRHNTLLHLTKKPSTSQDIAGAGLEPARSIQSNLCSMSQVLLKTALVKVHDQFSGEKTLRVLLDDGSQGSFITEACAKSLGLKPEKTNVIIKGILSSPLCSVKGKVNIELHSLVQNASLLVDALIVSKVTGILSSTPCNPKSWSHITGLQLADPQYFQPSKIDMLLGIDVLVSIVKEGVRHGPESSPMAQNTIFGWVICGPIAKEPHRVIQVNHTDIQIESVLQKFWELEELPPTKHFTTEEKLCEHHFQSTHTRRNDGRYIVKLPFNDKIESLGSSRDQAVSRFHQLDRRFNRCPDKREQYIKFMREYQSLNHMERVPTHLIHNSKSYYLPHHFVTKEDSSTTKLRVVFDGSAKTSSGVSLNNALRVGPTVQNDLFTLLLQFRFHLIALKADITKMYRQFIINESDIDYQRIVWRESPNQPLEDYRLLTVTYGTTSAPFLATRSLQQLATDEATNFPGASRVVSKDMYVDDLMSGENSVERAIHLQKQISQLVKAGGMEICKWSSNDPAVMASIPEHLRETKSSLSLDTDHAVKALGVLWNTTTDHFTFAVNTGHQSFSLTKRILLSELARVFDPLGWLSPVTIKAKLMFQDLWKEKTGWDDQLNQETQTQWCEYQSQMKYIESIRIPRCIIIPEVVQQQLHGFCDASEKAYAAVVYLRCEKSDGTVAINLLTSRTRVAPIKQVSLPRLELCGAVLVANLLKTVQDSINLRCPYYAWTDSTIVMKWLASFPGRWKTFVANRVAEIQDIISCDYWHHVRSEENPADLPSRGIPANQLVSSNIWWNGPTWLMMKTFPVSVSPVDTSAVKAEEKSKPLLVSQIQVKNFDKISKYSTLSKLKRVIAYCLRFVQNSRKQSAVKIYGELTTDELHLAMQKLIFTVQQMEFATEIKSINSSNQVQSSSKLKQLFPYLDACGILRVGGRLQHSSLSEERKHPVILPSQHHFTTLVIRDCHLRNLHSGFQLTWSTLQQQYWILRGRDTVRHLIRKCVVCRRANAVTATQLMGALPSPRVTPGRAFIHCGVDYAGPFHIRPFKGRSTKLFKCYFAVFVCLSTKAIHLETVSELSTEAFIAAFKRFSARRGVATDMYSDCSTNFTGADKALKSMMESSENQSSIHQFLADKGTRWHFNSPSAPHQGGLWEAGVKSVKYHFRRVVGCSKLTIEEFQTLLCLVESCLNSRPICALSSDPTDVSALTPGHFLIGHPLTAIPEPNLTAHKSNRLSKWQQVQQMFQHFWSRWNNEYLSSLQQRFKWKQKRRNLQIGELVIIRDETIPPMK